MHVTIVAHEVGTRGGMESQLGVLTDGLLAAGVEVIVITRRCDLPAHRNLTVHRVRTPRRPFPLGYPLFAVAAAWKMRRHARGVKHACGAIVPVHVDTATVHFCHAAYRDLDLGPRPSAPGRIRYASAWLSRAMAIVAERWCYQPGRVGRLIAVSPGVRDEMSAHFARVADRISVIPNGVDTDRFGPDPAARQRIRHALGIDDSALVAVFVGGDWKRKRLHLAVEAIARTEAWQLVIVGRGHPDQPREQARALHVEDRVHIIGETDAVQDYLAAADAFLLPTEYETFCLVAFEAASAGLPLLVTPVSGPDALIDPGVNGDFIGDDTERIAALLARYEASSVRRDHGEAARRAASTFTWERAVEMHLSLYEQLSDRVEDDVA